MADFFSNMTPLTNSFVAEELPDQFFLNATTPTLFDEFHLNDNNFNFENEFSPFFKSVENMDFNMDDSLGLNYPELKTDTLVPPTSINLVDGNYKLNVENFATDNLARTLTALPYPSYNSNSFTPILDNKVDIPLQKSELELKHLDTIPFTDQSRNLLNSSNIVISSRQKTVVEKDGSTFKMYVSKYRVPDVKKLFTSDLPDFYKHTRKTSRIVTLKNPKDFEKSLNFSFSLRKDPIYPANEIVNRINKLINFISEISQEIVHFTYIVNFKLNWLRQLCDTVNSPEFQKFPTHKRKELLNTRNFTYSNLIGVLNYLNNLTNLLFKQEIRKKEYLNLLSSINDFEEITIKYG